MRCNVDHSEKLQGETLQAAGQVGMAIDANTDERFAVRRHLVTAAVD